uniref:Uncharacterized protein MANES_01G192300 n=1 Tax=Rhizophora mucronata TaxID=61149 RepID=A0A2P2Q705_RHIMU
MEFGTSLHTLTIRSKYSTAKSPFPCIANPRIKKFHELMWRSGILSKTCKAISNEPHLQYISTKQLLTKTSLATLSSHPSQFLKK